MSEVEATLEAYRTRLACGGNSSPFLNPTPETNTRYDKPIATAQTEGLPIIDISAFLDPDSSLSARQTTAQAINAACVNYGFFYLTGHGIPLEMLDEVIDLARDFFNLPIEEKNKIKRYDAGGPEGGDGARGYQGLGENVTGGLQDMQEAIDWYADWPSEKHSSGDNRNGDDGSVKTLQGTNLWPSTPEKLKPMYLEYIERVKKVGKAVVHAMGVALELGPPKPGGAGRDVEDEEVFVRNCDESFWVMRMIGYPPLPTTTTTPSTSQTSTTSSSTTATTEEEISQFSCGAHTDYGCITLLHTDSTPSALQVRLKNGSWLTASPLRGAFVVNIGDMIERWTNGLWKSTLHRVIHRSEGYRVSVPFFFEPNFDALVKPLGRCVERTGGKGVSEGGTYGEHLLTKVFSNFYYSKRTDW
ncbi:hypothetical protein FB567DRAFT_634333 [Paraphoma chrysanthemicola]|uniref:Fe2OG dioxygenase domain-containing protein n=1 Tax=Paraphoma chrysanthemicola TaxID=798071 RepID=A0A8K0QSQ7_9PLEO|nr:hypothetical protein FB567DRAFT_634333 [Paraphoma chrysanthemicola]